MILIEGYINLCIELRVIFYNQQVYSWVKRNVIEDCNNSKGKKEEGNLKKKFPLQHIRAWLLWN